MKNETCLPARQICEKPRCFAFLVDQHNGLARKMTENPFIGSPSSSVQKPHQQNSEKLSSALEADSEREKISHKLILHRR
jgi:hypothetical protein